MNWWKTLLLGTLGYAIGGPIGALLGAAIGYGMREIGADSAGAGDPVRIQTVFFTTVFSVMGYVAKADGHVSRDEIRAAEAVMGHMQLGADQRRAAIRLFEEGKQAGFAFDAVMEQFRLECHRRRDLYRMFIEIQLQAAFADGEIHPAEKQALIAMCRHLGISRFELEGLEALIRAQRRTAGGQAAPKAVRLADDYRILGVSESASDAEVKKAYRRLMHQHHPDKLVAKGLPEEMMQVAVEKTREINAAYDRIKAARGMS